MNDEAGSLFDQIHQLAGLSLRGEIGIADKERLANLLRSSQEARQIYLRYLQESYCLRRWAGERPQPAAVRSRSMVAWQEWFHYLLQRPRSFAFSSRAAWLLVGVVATLGEVALILFLLAPKPAAKNGPVEELANDIGAPKAVIEEPAPVAEEIVASVVRTVECRWSGDEKFATGDEISQDSELNLESGFAELKFQSGARVLLQGPVRLTAGSALGGFLHQGRVTARVPQSAKGFTVSTPTGRVVDLGTEFGVQVRANGDSTVHVFQGSVQAVPNWSRPGEATLLVTSGQTARIDRSVKLLEGNEVHESIAQFQRLPATRQSFSLPQTGRGLDLGAEDPNWEIAHESQPDRFAPALVVRPHKDWLPNDRASSQWISLTDGGQPSRSGRFFYRTRFNLTGLDPTGARIVGGWIADNSVMEIRLNGKVVGTGRRINTYVQQEPFAITDGFLPGENLVEFVIYNDGPDPTGLRVEWSGTAEKLSNGPE